ncbi:MAG: hypothetical protein R2792_20005 [Saprospiraceae bacterium]
MREIKIADIILNLSDEGGNVRVKSEKENMILSNQDISTVSDLIKNNFNVVEDHYRSIINKSEEKFDLDDVNQVSLTIMLYYLYMYNSWRSMYKKQENRSLAFNKKDFNHPSTHDIVFSYFRTKYPNGWEEKCAVLLDMDISKLRDYYRTREQFYNK